MQELSLRHLTSIQHTFKSMRLYKSWSHRRDMQYNDKILITLFMPLLHYLWLWLDPHNRDSHCLSLGSTLHNSNDAKQTDPQRSARRQWHSAWTTYWFSPHPLHSHTTNITKDVLRSNPHLLTFKSRQNKLRSFILNIKRKSKRTQDAVLESYVHNSPTLSIYLNTISNQQH